MSTSVFDLFKGTLIFKFIFKIRYTQKVTEFKKVLVAHGPLPFPWC